MLERSSKSCSLGISSFTLHLIAMICMLCDHLWATIVPGHGWLTWIGRIAYPMFAFMVVEGYFYTHNFRKYLLRLLIFALLSEIPFNLMYAGSLIYPFHQNVLWTFLIVLLCIHMMESIQKKKRIILTILLDILIVGGGFIAATLTMTDYFGYGVLTALVFYFLRGNQWWKVLGQMAALFYINGIMMGGLTVTVNFLGIEMNIVQQSFAVLSLIPIHLYQGKQGPHNKVITYCFYGFYPMHMLVLALLWLS